MFNITLAFLFMLHARNIFSDRTLEGFWYQGSNGAEPKIIDTLLNVFQLNPCK